MFKTFDFELATVPMCGQNHDGKSVPACSATM